MRLCCLLLLWALLVTGCGKKAEEAPSPPPPPPSPAESFPPPVAERHSEAEVVIRPPTANADILGHGSAAAPPVERPPATKPVPAPRTISLESYSVTVAANETLELPGPPGELRVWIGISSQAPREQRGMKTETQELGAVGQTARVQPFSLGMDVEPPESMCEKIAPAGSEVRFKLTPRKAGQFTVGANVALYDTPDCSGPPVPKSAKSVTVNVVVNRGEIIKDKADEIGDVFWKAFLKFVAGLAALLFAVILWLLRKRIAKWLGYKGDGNDAE